MRRGRLLVIVGGRWRIALEGLDENLFGDVRNILTRFFDGVEDLALMLLFIEQDMIDPVDFGFVQFA